MVSDNVGLARGTDRNRQSIRQLLLVMLAVVMWLTSTVVYFAGMAEREIFSRLAGKQIRDSGLYA